MNEKVIEELESRICDLPGHETLGIFGKEAEGPLMTAGDLQTVFAALARTKAALDLANECVAHYADAGKWAHQDITDLSSGSPITVHTVVAFSKRSVEYGYDKARETQKEIEKLLGGDR